MLGSATTLLAEDVRLANGKKVPGTVVQVTDEGLEIQTSRGNQKLAWATLSAGTRYRHQPVYRENFESILKGEPASARTPPADSSSS